MEYRSSPHPHLSLPSGLEITPDPLLASPGYRAWVAELMEHPRPELWQDHHWMDDHLSLRDGQVWFATTVTLEGSQTQLSLQVPMTIADLRAYQQVLAAMPAQVDYLLVEGPLSLVGRGEELWVEGAQIIAVPEHLAYLKLVRCQVDVPLPPTEILVLYIANLDQQHRPVVAEDLLVLGVLGHDFYQAPAIWLLPGADRRQGWAAPERSLRADHYVVEEGNATEPARDRPCLFSRHRADGWHHTWAGTALTLDTPPALRTLVLLPGLEDYVAAVGARTVIVPTAHWPGLADHHPALEDYRSCGVRADGQTEFRLYRRPLLTKSASQRVEESA